VRHIVVLLALLLALAGGVVIADLRLLVLVPFGDGDDSAANAAVVRRFYAAVNTALGTGDVTPIGQLVAADFVDHAPPPGVAPDRTGLIGYLKTLHATEPDLWLTAVDLVAQGDRVAALVRAEGTNGTPVPGFPPLAGRVWSTLDLFRVESGRIVEHWADDTGRANVEPLLAVTVPVESPSTKLVEVGRLTYPPLATGSYWASGPTVLFFRAGDLVIDHDRISTDAATVVGTATGSRPLPPGESASLNLGDAVVLGRRSRYRIRNDGPTTAVVLTVWAGNPGGPTVASADAGTVQGTPRPSATYESLAGGVPAILPADRATVTIGRIALTPGAAVARHRVANAELAVVESGSVALTVTDGHAWEREAPDASINQMADSPLPSGAGIALDAGATVAYRPAGSEQVTMLLIAIGPVARL
jgi:predicted SnoaL-like aldol condensation-catalyzing enzyme